MQKVIEQYKSRPDVQFLMLSTDENPGLIGPFMQEHKYTFTVLPAYAYAEGSLKVFGIPENWIVDANGVVRLKGMGYDATGKWEKGMSEAIEKYAPEKDAPASASGPGN
ncbi:MAG TPA: hypothetical protein VFQ24_17840 [Terriglobia bacterium]|nr:hypothetical protein [Terriglobia bacterium]